MRYEVRLVLNALALALVSQATCLADGQERLLVHFAEKSSIDPASPTQVFRIDLDLTGDGAPEVLLCNTSMAGTSGLQGWFVYSKVGDGQYRFIGDIEFSYLLFRLSADGSKLMAYDKTEVGKGTIVTYRVDATGFHEESRKEGVIVGSDDWRQFEEWRKAVVLKVLATEFSDLLNNPSPTWTDILSKEPASGVPSIQGAVIVE